MSGKKSVPAIIISVIILIDFSVFQAHADTVEFIRGGKKIRIENVIDVEVWPSKTGITCIDISHGYARKVRHNYSFNESFDFEIKRSSTKERSQLIESWINKTNRVMIKRSFGPPVKAGAIGIRYPLSGKVNYIGLPPKIIEGQALYVKSKSGRSPEIKFDEIQLIEFSDEKAIVYWKKGGSSTGMLLRKWMYEKYEGEEAVLSGVNLDTMDIFELTMDSIQSIEFNFTPIASSKNVAQITYLDGTETYVMNPTFVYSWYPMKYKNYIEKPWRKVESDALHFYHKHRNISIPIVLKKNEIRRITLLWPSSQPTYFSPKKMKIRTKEGKEYNLKAYEFNVPAEFLSNKVKSAPDSEPVFNELLLKGILEIQKIKADFNARLVCYSGVHIQKDEAIEKVEFIDVEHLDQTKSVPPFDPKITSMAPDYNLEKRHVVSKHNGQKWAVIIGISEYMLSGKNGLSDLIFADEDAVEFSEVLKNIRWRDSHIKVITNERATERNIKIALESWLTKAGPEDMIVLFWAGHGYPDPEDPEKVYFACYDTDIKIPSTGFRMDRVRSILEERKSKNVIIFADTCHAGKLITRGKRGMSIIPTIERFRRENTVPRGWIFMVGADTDRNAIEHTSWTNGAFTHSLIKGLYGEADGFQSSGSNDGIVTMGELKDYMNFSMPNETQKVLGVAKRPVIVTSTGDPAIWNISLMRVP